MTQDNTALETKQVEYDDIDEIIEIAARKKQAAANRLSLDELREVAGELSIAPEHVEKALTELERRRDAEKRQRKRRKKQIQKGAAAVAIAAMVVVLMGWLSTHQLRSDLSAAQQQRAQVANVVDRHETTAEYFADRDDSMERAAELQGALNRVSVETRRYNEAASQYNRRATGFPSSVWAGRFGLPEQLPLSDDIDDW